MFGVDVGGTFTDVVAIVDGEIRVTKVPSRPDCPQDSVIEGARRLGVADARVFNHASTKGLNAVIQRKLPKIGFLTTEGHRDMLDAGRTWRPFNNQMNPGWRRPFGDAARPLVPRYLRRGVKERVLASGEVLIPLDEVNARAHLEVFRSCGVDGVAICLINAYVNGEHERRLLELVHEVLGDIPVSLSSQTSARAKEYPRATTTVIDVMMKGVYGSYADALDAGLRNLGFGGQLNFADCAASLLPWQEALRHPYRIVFAGPAAAALSGQHLGEAIGEPNLICCDVGGTSTDVALIMNGEPFHNDSVELEYDMLINALSIEVASVGAGGGSLVSVSPSGDIRVGPGSAGAIPGPACYGRGGSLPTVTDACLLMGILDPGSFADGQLQLDSDRAEAAFASLDTPLSMEQRVRYAFRIALNNIAEEVTNIAIRHGTDPRDFALVACGAGGPMLLAGVLDLLQVKEIIVPPHPGLFSALGLMASDHVYTEARSAYQVLGPDSAADIDQLYQDMERDLRQRLPVEAQFSLRRSFDGRLLGQSWETPFVSVPDGTLGAEGVGQMIEAFHAEYLRRNGQHFPHMPVQGVTYRVQLVEASPRFRWPGLAPGDGSPPQPTGQRELRFWSDTPVMADIYARSQLRAGDRIAGPAIIREALATILVLPGQQLQVGSIGELRISRREGRA